jgi:hypothetical protein
MTIPNTNSKLLVTEDWKKIYQSYPNAEFQSYDFDTLRRVLIAYLQENYPEDFNDYTDSSEYIALVDLIAYLGQNLSFRIDLNARENFLETAQRRDSILRLAQLISYVPKRNTPASGIMKLSAISTTDSVFDSSGINLANTTVIWNDVTNANWYEQFISIVNSTLFKNYSFGTPNDRKVINGIDTSQYFVNSSNTDVPVYSFTKTINGNSMLFEIVASTISSGAIEESVPAPGNSFNLIYQSDNQGNSSPNTGFFVYFKQGKLGISNFSITNPTANELIGVNISNINNDDVWLWQLDSNGNYSTLWSKVPAITGSSVIYNSIDASERNVYSVTTRDNDQIDLNFADGSFGNLPQGTFSLFYRQSNGLTYTITPQEMGGVVVRIPYFNQAGQTHTLTLTLGLQYSVSNSAATESNAGIQLKAPQTYYTQNRMVTAEDYNITPLNLGSDILKVKSIARVTSGVSRFFELTDVSGKYSNTNIFADDGILYKETDEAQINFSFSNRNQIWSFVKNTLEPLLKDVSLRSFYLDEYPRPDLAALSLRWVKANTNAVSSTGYFESQDSPENVGVFVSNNLRYVKPGSLIKFVVPASLPISDFRYNASKKYFKSNGLFSSTAGTKYLWASVKNVIGDGSNTGQGLLDNGTGPIILSRVVDNAAIPVEVIPPFLNSYSYAFENEIVNICLSQKNFGLYFDEFSRTWRIVSESNLDLVSDFSLVNQGDGTGLNRDSSWLIAFEWQGTSYKLRQRFTQFLFESSKKTAFYTDSTNVNYNFYTNTVVKDQISVLSVNSVSTSTAIGLDKDYVWQIDGNVVETDGYINPSKVKVSFFDNNNSGDITDPDSYLNVVSSSQYVFFQYQSDGETLEPVDSSLFVTDYATATDVPAEYKYDEQLYYFYADDVVNIYNELSSQFEYTSTTSNYVVYNGRDSLKFQYLHNSGEERRLDPSKTNIIDIYLMTKTYDTAFRFWLSTGVGDEPLPPTTAALEKLYNPGLNNLKTISDEIVFQSARYKILFGSQAKTTLRARFKAVRNSASIVSDSAIKSRILNAINDFFDLQNWDFGQSFYFSELSTYVMNIMTPDITNFILVPDYPNNFGSLYEVTCLSNEVFINGATVNEIDVIDAVTASQLKSTNIVNSSGS